MRAKTIAIILVELFLLNAMAYAVSFKIPGTNEKFGGKSIDMRQTSIGKRNNITGTIWVGENPTHNNWAMLTKAGNLHPNGTYVLALVNSNYKILKKDTADSRGNLVLSWSGKINPKSYTDVALYYLPNSSAKPGAGAIRVLSVRTSDLANLSSP